MSKLSIDHIGWAVHSIEKALPAMNSLGFESAGNVCDDTARFVRILLMKDKSGGTVELVEPMENTQNPISNFLAKNSPAPYHCCFAVDKKDRKEAIAALKEAKFIELIKETPAPALGGDGVVFLYSKEVGLVEVVVR